MIGYLRQVHSQLEGDLKKINLEETNLLCAAKKSLVVIRECCRQLSTIGLQCDFKNSVEEIYFFKELKCYYYSRLYYYQDIIEIECGMPIGSQESKQNFLKERLQKLNEHFLHHRYLYTYLRSGETERDEQYFTLIKRHDTKLDDQGRNMFCEDDYSSVYDLLFARIISNDKLEKYLHLGLIESNGKEKYYENVTPLVPKLKLEWTDSKVALVELLYGLHESKCINDGKADMKELVRMAQFLFNGIDLGDFYRTYLDLRNRTERTKFINTIKKSLEERMNKDDEKENPGFNSLRK